MTENYLSNSFTYKCNVAFDLVSPSSLRSSRDWLICCKVMTLIRCLFGSKSFRKNVRRIICGHMCSRISLHVWKQLHFAPGPSLSFCLFTFMRSYATIFNLYRCNFYLYDCKYVSSCNRWFFLCTRFICPFLTNVAIVFLQLCSQLHIDNRLPVPVFACIGWRSSGHRSFLFKILF